MVQTTAVTQSLIELERRVLQCRNCPFRSNAPLDYHHRRAVPRASVTAALLRKASGKSHDFYRVLPGENGEVLVVLGDVIGKGLRAALTVSTIVGSLRMLPNHSPVEILRELNPSLAGNLRGGLVTCLAARIHADGAVALANAGHLPPYRDGEEILLPPSLPLGITADAEYAESNFQLAPGDTFTFFSDGVVEAQSRTGFERTGSISRQSAQEIAVAKAFGQEDDITVVTLQFAPA